MKLANLKLDRSGPFSLPLVAAFLLLFSLSLAPAQTQRLAKVGYLGFGTAVPPALFQNRMRELGYSEGKDISVEYRFADGRPERLRDLARELVDAKVGVIMATGDEAIVAARNATGTIPIVMVACDAGGVDVTLPSNVARRPSDGSLLSTRLSLARLTQTERLGQLGTTAGVIRSHHRVVALQAPTG